MVGVTVEVRRKPAHLLGACRASSIERALEIVGKGKPGRRVRLVFPIDPEIFFVPAASGARMEAA